MTAGRFLVADRFHRPFDGDERFRAQPTSARTLREVRNGKMPRRARKARSNGLIRVEGAPTSFMIASGGVLSEGYGPGLRLGDGQTEAEGVPSLGRRGDALLPRMPPHLTCPERALYKRRNGRGDFERRNGEMPSAPRPDSAIVEVNVSFIQK